MRKTLGALTGLAIIENDHRYKHPNIMGQKITMTKKKKTKGTG
jgi:hypothetical protein